MRIIENLWNDIVSPVLLRFIIVAATLAVIGSFIYSFDK